MSPAVASAVELHEKGVISANWECIRKTHCFRDAANTSILMWNSASRTPWRIVGVKAESNTARIACARNGCGDRPSQNASARWDLISMIVKSNDDVRQEVCVLQLIRLCGTIFCGANLELWLRPYSIISTSASTGLIEVCARYMRARAWLAHLRASPHLNACSRRSSPIPPRSMR